MTARRMLPVMLIAALAAACSKTPTQATGPLTTTSSPMAASAMPLLSAQQGADPVGPGCASVVGTFYGQYTGTWDGTAYLRIAGDTVKMAIFHDVGGPGFRPHGARGGWSGTETNTITFIDGSGSFQVPARYNAQVAGTPELYILHETGTLTGGTVNYEGVSGHVAVDGPFTLPDVGDLIPQWIGEMHGSICGLQ